MWIKPYNKQNPTLQDLKNTFIQILSKKNASFEIFTAIVNLERLIARSWSVTTKTPVYQFPWVVGCCFTTAPVWERSLQLGGDFPSG